MTSTLSAPAHADEGGRAWLIVAALFLMLSIVITARNCLGLMMPFWQADLGWSYKTVSEAGAGMLLVMAVFAPLVGVVLDRFGARTIYGAGMTVVGIVFILCSFMTEQWQLFALFSVAGGVAFAALAPSLVSTTVAQHFRERLGLATSIASAGSTGGQLALMPLFALLISTTSWRFAFVVVGVTVFATAVVVTWLIGPSKRNPSARAGADSGLLFSPLRALCRDRTFWLLAGGFFICGFTTAGVIKIHLIPYAVSCGFPPLQSATAYGVLSAFSLIGMIGFGWLSDRFHRPVLLAAIYFLRALTFVMLMYVAGNTPLLFLFAVMFGLFDYATFPIVASLVATHIGRHVMGLTMGLIFGGHSLGGALGSLTGGYLFDIYARYDWVWIISVGLALTAALLSILIRETRTPEATAAAGARA